MRALAVSLLLFAALVQAESQRTIAPAKAAPGGERRVALVVGNAAYVHGPLRNPVNDARAIAQALSETGFTVRLLEDASQAAMRRAIRDFGDELAGGVGLFYYAGHGMQVRGKNYLVPVNADIQREDEIVDQAVDADLVLAKMDTARNRLNLVILDACRNNPFARSFRSSAQGLAQMDAPAGTLIAFATAPGQVASDGDGANGLYTKHLLEAIRQPGLPIEQLFKQVRIGVTRETADRQVPWESSSLKGDFYFVPGGTSGISEAQVRRMIDEALARQRAEFERERAAPPVGGAAAKTAAWPRPGDRWTYRASNLRRDKVGELEVHVKGVSEQAILDVSRGGAGEPKEFAHTDKVYVAGVAPGIALFPPYLQAFRTLKAGDRWSEIPFVNLGKCSIEGALRCTASAEVEGRETVNVPAGSFDAWRVVVTVSAAGPRGRALGAFKLVYWYAESAKRMVKYRGAAGGGEDAVEIELAFYQLN